MSRYLVTGRAGFIGSRLVDALLDRGEEVTGVDAFTNFYPRAAKEGNLDHARRRDGFSLVEGDLVDVALEPLVSEVAGVFHLAARPGVRGSWGASFRDYVRDNLLVSQRLFEQPQKRVFGSFSRRLRRSMEMLRRIRPLRTLVPVPCPLWRNKARLRAPSTDVRHGIRPGCRVPALFLGLRAETAPRHGILKDHRRGLRAKPFQILGSGEQSRDFTYVDDVISANVAAMDRAPAGAVYNVGGGSEVSIREAIDLCQQVSGRTLEVRHDPAVKGDASRTAADTSRIHADLDWKPRTDLAQGLSAQLAWAEGKAAEQP
jgi:UDP-glucuronate 4-epimerase